MEEMKKAIYCPKDRIRITPNEASAIGGEKGKAIYCPKDRIQITPNEALAIGGEKGKAIYCPKDRIQITPGEAQRPGEKEETYPQPERLNEKIGFNSTLRVAVRAGRFTPNRFASLGVINFQSLWDWRS